MREYARTHNGHRSRNPSLKSFLHNLLLPIFFSSSPFFLLPVDFLTLQLFCNFCLPQIFFKNSLYFFFLNKKIKIHTLIHKILFFTRKKSVSLIYLFIFYLNKAISKFGLFFLSGMRSKIVNELVQDQRVSTKKKNFK